jgi:SAM-dependent methyltransferase
MVTIVNETLLRAQQFIIEGRKANGLPVGYYEQEYRKSEIGYWSNIPEWVYTDFDGNRDLKILDIGCAYGTLLIFSHLVFPQSKLYALDALPYLEPWLLNQAGIEFVVGDLERDSMPWTDTFDIIFFTEVLEHLNNNPIPSIQKISQLLKQDGKLYLTTPDRLEWGPVENQPKSYCDLSAATRRDAHCYIYTDAEVKRIVSVAGLEVQRTAFSTNPLGRHLNYTLVKAIGAI